MIPHDFKAVPRNQRPVTPGWVLVHFCVKGLIAAAATLAVMLPFIVSCAVMLGISP